MTFWGKTKFNTTRFYCTVCGKTFTDRRPSVRRSNRLSWFKTWLTGNRIDSIAVTSGRNRNTVRSAIRWFLEHPPVPKPFPNAKAYLLIDATWFGRKNCLIVYWDTKLKRAQWWRFSKRKEAIGEIKADLSGLKEAGVIPTGVTSDGAAGIVGAVKFLYPSIPHQRCLVHLQRMALIFLTQRPKTEAGVELREMAKRLNSITTHADHYFWQRDFYRWCHRYHSLLKERSFSFRKAHWWYTHRYLRKVRRMIVNALPDMWHYLDHSGVNKDTNGLEGRWSSLKIHYRQHRGLPKRLGPAYFSWYLTTVVNREKPTTNWY